MALQVRSIIANAMFFLKIVWIYLKIKEKMAEEEGKEEKTKGEEEEERKGRRRRGRSEINSIHHQTTYLR